MRMRSTGLGKTELVGEVVGLEPKGDLLILHIQTTRPVRWHLRAGIQRFDRLELVKWLLRLNVRLIPYLLRWKSRQPPREPEEF
ncbi:hypothetical protein DRO33_06425 [Candidatus Bathyarchaeota archaeon]|nr:MAG: hypothetical protein DRO33_06425 [Candidatus Bathyarchaeota archaeon]